MQTDQKVDQLIASLFGGTVIERGPVIDQEPVIPRRNPRAVATYAPPEKSIEQRLNDLIMAMVAERLATLEMGVNRRVAQLDAMIEEVKAQQRQLLNQRQELEQARTTAGSLPRRYNADGYVCDSGTCTPSRNTMITGRY